MTEALTLDELRRCSVEDIARLQELRARETLAAAAESTRLWSRLLDARDPWTVPWQDIPVTDREVVVAGFSDSVVEHGPRLADVTAHFRAGASQPLDGRYQVFVSAGRDGDLASFVYDDSMWRAYLAAIRRRIPPHIQPGRVALVGTSDTAHTLSRSAPAFADAEVRIVGLQRGLDACISALDEFQPDALVGFSSAVVLLAETQLDGRMSIDPRLVLVGTDAIAPEARDLVSRAWASSPLDVYASTEAGVIAFECSHGSLHVNEDLVRIEVEATRLLVTNLVNRVQPIIRYALPDNVRTRDGPCSCGLPLRRIELAAGRVVEAWRLPGARGATAVVHPIVLRSALDTLPGVTRSSAGVLAGRLVVTVSGNVDVRLARVRVLEALSRADVDTATLDLDIRVGHAVPCGAGNDEKAGVDSARASRSRPGVGLDRTNAR